MPIKEAMKLSLIVVCVALAGCAGGWSRPGGSEADFNRDRYQCQTESAQTYPVMMTQSTYGSGYQSPSRTQCQTFNGITNCTTTPGTYTPPIQQTTDANAIARASAFGSCMRSRGYTFSLT